MVNLTANECWPKYMSIKVLKKGEGFLSAIQWLNEAITNTPDSFNGVPKEP